MEVRIIINIKTFFVVVISIIVTFIIAGASEGTIYEELPYCGPDNSHSQDVFNKLVFVSTLDGRLSALNAIDGGAVTWSIDTGPGPMLSSSIHRLELTNNGHWVRMIPSLSGGLYKFNGDSIEVVPITADHLLQSSSFLFSDGVIISGGKESRTYGVALKSGRVLYECSMKGCHNYTENISNDGVMVIQRQTQTVRGVEARTGAERWNFSVGQHELRYMRDPNANCHNIQSDKAVVDFELKVVVPEGLVCAVSKSKPENMLWKHKFDSPIVAAWQVKQGQMYPVDLFSGSQWSSSYTDNVGPISPTLYIGMHKKQLYIQESVTLQKSFADMSSKFITEESSTHLRIPWEPVSASSTALGIAISETEKKDSAALQVIDVPTTALSVLYASEYVNGNGYFLFSGNSLKRAQNVQCKKNITIEGAPDENSDEFDFLEEDTPVQVIIVSLWYWWKEVLVISVTTAVVVNLIVTQRFLQGIQTGIAREVVRQKIIVVEKSIPSLPEKDSGCELRLSVRSNSDPGQEFTPEFTSRYLNDFDVVHCLGRGGFGVVFEAKNKIDECNYAIKRIALPNNQESRDRVMREVKALAKLDHHHIVRYFNAWMECPPAGWQEKHDKAIFNGALEDATSIDLTGLSKGIIASEHNTFNESFTSRNGASVFLNFQNNGQIEGGNTNDSFFKNNSEYSLDKSDSFIVFETSKRHSLDDVTSNNKLMYDSVITVSSSEGDTSEKKNICRTAVESCVIKSLLKRPASLNVASDGAVVIPGKPTRVYLYIQMQLCHRESLREWLRDNVERDTPKVLHMFEQIVQAVEYVHLQGLIHRDLKPSNIFFSMTGQIKVGDFGLVTAMVENATEQRTPCHDNSVVSNSEKHTAQVGTQLYMSPEQMNGQPYDYKVDIYSLGLILFELLVPFCTQMERGQTLTNLRQNKFPSAFQQQFKEEYELLQLMLSHCPEKRPTTYGIRARPPLCHNSNKEITEQQWHFDLPPRRRDSSKASSISNSSSIDSWDHV